MKVGLLYNKKKSESVHYVELLKQKIEEISQKESADGKKWQVTESSDYFNNEVVDNADLLISIGGDGTFLKTASVAIKRDLPVLGFHLGTLGLLTEFDKSDMDNTVRRLVKGNYVIEERMTLNVDIEDESGNVLFSKTAINDCVLTRGSLTSAAMHGPACVRPSSPLWKTSV